MIRVSNKIKLALLAAALPLSALAQANLSISGGNLVLTGGNNGIAGIQFTITPGLGISYPILNAVLAATPTPGKTFTCFSPTGGTGTNCIIIGNNANPIPDGPLVTWAGAFVPTNIFAASPTGTSVALTFIPSKCDLDGNGVVDNNDSSLAISYVIGLKPAPASADITGDGTFNIFDAFRVIVAANGGTCKVGP